MATKKSPSTTPEPTKKGKSWKADRPAAFRNNRPTGPKSYEAKKSFGDRTSFSLKPNAALLKNSKIDEIFPELKAKNGRKHTNTPERTMEIENYTENLEKRGKKTSVYLNNPTSISRITKCVQQVANRKTVLFCIDVEAFERNTKCVLEIGISIYDPRLQENAMFPVIHQFHILLKETLKMKNGAFVPNNRDNFLGGDSLVLSCENAATLVQLLINHYFVDLPQKNPGYETALVGHSVKGDVTWFQSLGISFPQELLILDTKDVWVASQGDKGCNLGKILQRLRVNHSYLHNAGNDAYFTLILAMMLGDPSTRIHHELDTYISPPDSDLDPAVSQISMMRIKYNGATHKPKPVTYFGQFRNIDRPIDAVETVLFPSKRM